MAVFIGTSAGYYGRSLHGHIQIQTGTSLDVSRDIYRYQILYSNVIQLLNSYINFFSTGNYTSLKSKLTIKAQNQLTSIIKNSDYYYNTNIDNLNDFNYDANMFENFRNNTYYILNGLIQAVSQYDQLDALQNEVSECRDILSSEQKIIDYLNSNKQPSMVAFTANQAYNTNIVLKPWYERYIILFGPPNDGVFLTEKMAISVQQLINEGVITLEQFTTNSSI
jgi:hypothetical protein